MCGKYKPYIKKINCGVTVRSSPGACLSLRTTILLVFLRRFMCSAVHGPAPRWSSGQQLTAKRSQVQVRLGSFCMEFNAPPVSAWVLSRWFGFFSPSKHTHAGLIVWIVYRCELATRPGCKPALNLQHLRHKQWWENTSGQSIVDNRPFSNVKKNKTRQTKTLNASQPTISKQLTCNTSLNTRNNV